MSTMIDRHCAKFVAADIPVADLNGHGPGFTGSCPVCGEQTTARPVDLPDLDFMKYDCGCNSAAIWTALLKRESELILTRELADLSADAWEPEAGVHAVDRYANRRVDIAAMLARPPRPTPWRVVDLVADRTLTILSGESGDGKSWLALALCVGVARGSTVGGFLCLPGTALYVDGEMGDEMFVERLRTAGIGAEIELRDAMGLDLSTPGDLEWLRREIEGTGAKFVVIDSLRRLTPSKGENDSDDMAPTIAALAQLARKTGAAMLLIHHKGDSEKFYRGSTAIKDQADALFGMLRDENEPEVRRLSCRGGKGKMRYSREPADRYLTIDPHTFGIAAADKPEASGPMIPTREALGQAIKAALPVKFKKEAAEKVGRHINDRAFRAAWAGLENGDEIAHISGTWVDVVSHPTLGDERLTTSDDEAPS